MRITWSQLVIQQPMDFSAEYPAQFSLSTRPPSLLFSQLTICRLMIQITYNILRNHLRVLDSHLHLVGQFRDLPSLKCIQTHAFTFYLKVLNLFSPNYCYYHDESMVVSILVQKEEINRRGDVTTTECLRSSATIPRCQEKRNFKKHNRRCGSEYNRREFRKYFDNVKNRW